MSSREPSCINVSCADDMYACYISKNRYNVDVMSCYAVNQHMDKVSKILYQTGGKAIDFQDLMQRFSLDSIGQVSI
jgi:hypothetical protein